MAWVWGEPKFFAVLDFFSASYFTVPVLLTLNLFFIVVALLNFRKIRELRVLLVYALFSFFRHLLDIYFNVFEEYSEITAKRAATTLRLFILVEFVLFYRFIGISLRSAMAKAALKILLPLFAIAVLAPWLSGNQAIPPTMNLSVAESYLIIFPILFYYYELFHHPPVKNLMKSPRFWGLTGIFFLFILIMPLSFQSGLLFISDGPFMSDKPVRYLHALNFIGYIVLFLFFINALRWKLQTPNT